MNESIEQKAIDKISSIKNFNIKLDTLQDCWEKIVDSRVVEHEFDRIREFCFLELKDARTKLCELRGE